MGNPVAHAGGSSLDEFVAQIMLFGAIALGVAGWLAHGRASWWRSWGFVVLAVAVAASAFVVPQRYLRVTPSKVRPAAGAAAVEILNPQDGAVIRGSSLVAVVVLQSAQIVGTSRTPRTGRGHLHVSVDTTLLTQAGGLRTMIDLRPFKAGSHTLTIELVAADHGSFSPPVRDSVPFVKETG